MAGKNVVRSDVVQISYEVDDSPLQDISREINSMKNYVVSGAKSSESALSGLQNEAKGLSSTFSTTGSKADSLKAGLQGAQAEARQLSSAFAIAGDKTDSLKADLQGAQAEARETSGVFSRLSSALSGSAIGRAFQNVKAYAKSSMDALSNGASNAKTKVEDVKDSTEGLSGSLSKLKGVIVGALGVGTITAFGKSAIQASADMEVLKKGLTFVLGSEKETNKLVTTMQGIGEASAYDTNQLIPMARQWVNLGFNAEDACDKMKTLVDVGSAFGLTTDQMESANLALTQMISSGKVSSENMQQLTDAGIPAWKMLAEAMGMSVSEVRDLSQQGELGAEALDTLEKAFKEKTVGATESMADTLMAKMSNIQEAVTNSMGAIGDIIVQAFDIKGVLDEFGGYIEAFKGHIENIREQAKNIGVKDAIINELEAINPVIGGIFGVIIDSIVGIKNIITENWSTIKPILTVGLAILGAYIGILGAYTLGTKLATAAELLKTGALQKSTMAMIKANLAMLANPWTWVVIGIVALVAGLIYLARNWDNLKEIVMNFVDTCTGYLSDFWNWLSGIFSSMADSVVGFFTGVFNFLVDIHSRITDFIVGVLTGIYNFIAGILKSIWSVIGGAVMSIFDVWYTAWSYINQILIVILQGIWNAISSWFSNIVAFISDCLTSIWNFTSSIFSTVYGFISGIFSSIYAVISMWLTSVWSFISSIFSTVYGFISGIMQSVYGVISGAWNSAYNAVSGALSNILAGIKSKFTEALNWLTGLKDRFCEIGKNLIQGLIDGFTSKMKSLKDKIANVGESALGATKKVFGVHSPSREFAIIGRYNMMGLEKGMTDNLPDLTQTVTTIGRNTMDSYSDGYTPESAPVSSGGNVTEHNTFNPQFNLTVNGAEDTRDMERKVRQWVIEAMQDAFSSYGRKRPRLREV